jgi:hypothetical protein
MLNKGIWLLVAFLLLAAAQPEAAPRFEIMPFAGMRFGGSFSDGAYSNVIWSRNGGMSRCLKNCMAEWYRFRAKSQGPGRSRPAR